MISKKFWVSGLAGLLLIAGIGQYRTLSSRNNRRNETEINPTAVGINPDKSGSLWELITSGDRKKCTFSIKNKEKDVTGEIYTAGERAAITMTYTVNQVNSDSQLVRAGKQVYTWNNIQKTGILYNIDPTAESSWIKGTIPEGLSQLASGMQYKCEDWEETEEVFKIPPDIRFLEIEL